jgi:hypothetical protein
MVFLCIREEEYAGNAVQNSDDSSRTNSSMG